MVEIVGEDRPHHLGVGVEEFFGCPLRCQRLLPYRIIDPPPVVGNLAAEGEQCVELGVVRNGSPPNLNGLVSLETGRPCGPGVCGLAVRAVVHGCHGEVDRLAGGVVECRVLGEMRLHQVVHLDERRRVGHSTEDVGDISHPFRPV